MFLHEQTLRWHASLDCHLFGPSTFLNPILGIHFLHLQIDQLIHTAELPAIDFNGLTTAFDLAPLSVPTPSLDDVDFHSNAAGFLAYERTPLADAIVNAQFGSPEDESESFDFP